MVLFSFHLLDGRGEGGVPPLPLPCGALVIFFICVLRGRKQFARPKSLHAQHSLLVLPERLSQIGRDHFFSPLKEGNKGIKLFILFRGGGPHTQMVCVCPVLGDPQSRIIFVRLCRVC